MPARGHLLQSSHVTSMILLVSNKKTSLPWTLPLGWEFVKNVYDDQVAPGEKLAGEPCAWRKICISDGRVGYICDQYLRSPFEYRAGFEQKKGVWTMIYFTTGAD